MERPGRGSVVLALAVLAIGCGTAAPASAPPPEAAPPSVQASLVAAFESFEETDRGTGWTRERCAEVASEFVAAAVGTEAPSDRADAFYMAGMAHQRCGDRAAAREAYEAALEADPAHCRARVGLGLALRADGDDSGAERAMRIAAARSAGCAEAFVELASIDRRRGALDDAERSARHALALDGEYVEALHELALVHLDRSTTDVAELPLAELACDQARRIDPSYAPAYNTSGVVSAQQGHLVEAVARFRRAVELDPSLFEAWMNWAQISLSFRAYDDAERAFGEAIRVRPNDYDALLGHGVALRGLGRMDAARARYLAARDLDPERPEAWFNLGVLHQDHLDGDPEELEDALGYLEVFVEKASGQPEHEAAVSEVSRCCSAARGATQRAECRPGRLQNLRAALRAAGRRPHGC